MDETMRKTREYLEAVESLAQDILTERSTKLELSNAANKYNEGIRALEKTEERKTWLRISDFYLELPVGECVNLLKDGTLKKCFLLFYSYFLLIIFCFVLFFCSCFQKKIALQTK